MVSAQLDRMITAFVRGEDHALDGGVVYGFKDGVRVVSEEKRDGEVLKKFRFGDGQGSGDQGLESVCTNLEMQLADASTNQSGDLEDLMEGNDAIGCQ